MEELARGRGIEPPVERRLAVRPVADHGTAQTRQMHADLMRPPRLDATFEERRRRGAGRDGDDPPVRDRELAPLLDDRHALAVDRMATDEVLDSSGVEAGTTVDDREIRLLDVPMGGERPDESVHRGLRLGDDKQTARVLVEAVDDAGARHAADARERRTVVEKRVDERAGEVSRRRMYDEAGRLVDADEIVVFVDDRKGDVLWLGHGRHGRGDGDDDAVRLRDLHPRLFGDSAVDGDETGLDQALDPRAREAGMRFEDLPVEPHRLPRTRARTCAVRAGR